MKSHDRLLRTFLRIADLTSLSRAAHELGQTQSGVSKQLATLEAEIGQPLFIRNGRGVTLTDVGVALQQAIEVPYRAIDHALEAIRYEHGAGHATLRIAFVHTVNDYFLPDAVAGFVAKYPDVSLSLIARSSSDVVMLVEGGRADLGIVYDTAVDTAALSSHPLFEDSMCLVTVRKTEAKTSEVGIDLRGRMLRLVGFPRGFALRRMVESAGLKPLYVAEAESVDSILKLVSMGVGDSILPSRLPDKLLNEHGLRKIRIDSPHLRRRMVAIKHVARKTLPIVDALFNSVLQVASTLR
ncbi:LysR family transcriptional regulator [Cupriavidus pauculus]|uniref:LysR family transcriptional regulator n=1 Tax=Cupriavidus pauculus TaxID=82633 RepID=A0A2N5C5P2_9BURK|nr:LysR family transcriptional regulator [Cupriavidus pauculus]PLP97555.1 LysR family transcriptional regulator [Cupriavidus pauculus]